MDKPDGVGDEFQRHTEFRRDEPGRARRRAIRRPSPIKVYRGTETIALPPPQTTAGSPIWKVIEDRRSERDFVNRPLPLAALSQLLWAAHGLTSPGGEIDFRAAPSSVGYIR